MVDEIYSSRASFENALEKAKQEKRWSDAGGYLRDACLLYTDLVDDVKASLLEAAEYFEKEGNKAEQAWCYHDLGGWYLEATKGDEAVQWLEKSISLFEELKDEPWAKEGLQSTQSVLNEILSEKPFQKKKESEENLVFLTEGLNRNGIENGFNTTDPTDIPTIKMAFGFIVMLFGFAIGNKDWILTSLFTCGVGLIILISGLLGVLKAKQNQILK